MIANRWYSIKDGSARFHPSFCSFATLPPVDSLSTPPCYPGLRKQAALGWPAVVGLGQASVPAIYPAGVSPVIDTSYAVVGFGEASPPQDLLFPTCGGGFAATTRGKERISEGRRPSEPPAEDATA